MNIKKDKKYILRFSVNEVTLVYTGVIVSIDHDFITFIDKFGKELSYNLKNLVSYGEVGE